MSSNDDMDARHGRMLAELAEAGMGLASRLYAASQQPGNTQDLIQLAEAFHSVSRSIRQTIALEFKLKHAPREPAAPKPEPRPAASPAERPERPERPEPVYWSEYERADWDEPLDALLASGDRDAINAAVGDSIARIRRGLTEAEGVLARHHPNPGRSGLGAAQDRDPWRAAPPVRPRTRGDLLSTSSPLGPGLRAPPYQDDSGGGAKAPGPPPRRSSA